MTNRQTYKQTDRHNKPSASCHWLCRRADVKQYCIKQVAWCQLSESVTRLRAPRTGLSTNGRMLRQTQYISSLRRENIAYIYPDMYVTLTTRI